VDSKNRVVAIGKSSNIHHLSPAMDFESLFPLRYCLNLKRRPERWETACRTFAGAGLEVQRWEAADGQKVRNAHGYAWASRYAVGLSKRAAVRQARVQAAPGIFLFEDDVELPPDWRMKLERFELPEDWGMLLLGRQHLETPRPAAPGLVRVKAAVDNHAIGFRRCWYERILYTLAKGKEDAKIWPHTASDRHLAALMREVPTYAPWPNLAWQREGHSDQTGTTYSLYTADGRQKGAGAALRSLDHVWEKPPGPLKGEPIGKRELAFLGSWLQRCGYSL
jgi:hypothetical protein